MKITAEELISSMGWNYENTETSARFVAEHCVKNFYSEEELLEILHNIFGVYGKHIGFVFNENLIKDLFEQFKKK
jgi:hypothetical protein